MNTDKSTQKDERVGRLVRIIADKDINLNDGFLNKFGKIHSVDSGPVTDVTVFIPSLGAEVTFTGPEHEIFTVMTTGGVVAYFRGSDLSITHNVKAAA